MMCSLNYGRPLDRRDSWKGRTGISGKSQSITVESTSDTSRPTMTSRVSKQERRQAPASPATMRRVDEYRRSLLTTSSTLQFSLNLFSVETLPFATKRRAKLLFSTTGYDNPRPQHVRRRQNRYVDRT